MVAHKRNFCVGSHFFFMGYICRHYFLFVVVTVPIEGLARRRNFSIANVNISPGRCSKRMFQTDRDTPFYLNYRDCQHTYTHKARLYCRVRSNRIWLAARTTEKHLFTTSTHTLTHTHSHQTVCIDVLIFYRIGDKNNMDSVGKTLVPFSMNVLLETLRVFSISLSIFSIRLLCLPCSLSLSFAISRP